MAEGFGNNLRKIRKLGGGSYGVVYEAMTGNLRENHIIPGVLTPIKSESVAVKRNFVPTTAEGSISCLREMDILNLVANHPYCIEAKYISFGAPFESGILSPDITNHVSDKIYFVLEKGKMDGDHFIHPPKHSPQPKMPDRKLFAVQLLLAIEFLHSRGIYHRDLKPSNIICFFNETGEFKSAKIIDFGLAQFYSKQPISVPGFVTIWYRAPEISLCKEYDTKVDAWSAGCILFELFSLGSVRFMRPEKDEHLINHCIQNLPFSAEDYMLAKAKYTTGITKSYDRYQKNLPTLTKLLNYGNAQILSFNASQVGGKLNPGTYDEFLKVLEGLLMVNPKKRWSVTEALNAPFFNGWRTLINKTRTFAGINHEGQWILKPIPVFDYKKSEVRQRGMKWFQFIYSCRKESPISNWYNHRMLFHAIEMFDRFCLLTNQENNNIEEGTIALWINAFCFISSKYFRILVPDVAINYFNIGFSSDVWSQVKKEIHDFEEIVIRDIFCFKIYQQTIYETATEFLTENSIIYLIKLVTREYIHPKTPLDTIWSVYYDDIKRVNQITMNMLTQNK